MYFYKGLFNLFILNIILFSQLNICMIFFLYYQIQFIYFLLILYFFILRLILYFN